jgi:methylmalonyl-CoA mutase cobalamin-binding subunit
MVLDARKIRVLLTKSQKDGYDRRVRYLARKLREAGMEIVF